MNETNGDTNGMIAQQSPLLADYVDAGRLLKMSPRTVMRLHKAGVLKSVPGLGRLVRFSITGLEAWIARASLPPAIPAEPAMFDADPHAKGSDARSRERLS